MISLDSFVDNENHPIVYAMIVPLKKYEHLYWIDESNLVGQVPHQRTRILKLHLVFSITLYMASLFNFEFYIKSVKKFLCFARNALFVPNIYTLIITKMRNFFVYSREKSQVFHFSLSKKGTYPRLLPLAAIRSNKIRRKQKRKFTIFELAFALFGWLISHDWKYCWLICCKRKILFVGWKSTVASQSVVSNGIIYISE